MESNYFFGDDERSEKGVILTSLTTYNHISSTGFVIQVKWHGFFLYVNTDTLVVVTTNGNSLTFFLSLSRYTHV